VFKKRREACIPHEETRRDWRSIGVSVREAIVVCLGMVLLQLMECSANVGLGREKVAGNAAKYQLLELSKSCFQKFWPH
jgi:hypothetical protein